MFHLIVLSDSNIKIETLHGMVTLDYIIERKTFGRDVIKLSGINDDNKVSTKEFDGAEFMIISHDKIQSMGKYSYIEKNEVYELMNKK